eukprot:CAMPEP_0198301446 /NCGR_PEP_ID=MMETSP1449-20131203/51627_1 /TAXON_ID=420275 /ORGANISM="Attheya septentrionalis, Strain CCMP2084" /LENGTH=73 /DNA_ID=CAMNT_0044003525 /DNA_START=50 /DNA_END=268 /DNA_ORIENTATION=+
MASSTSTATAATTNAATAAVTAVTPTLPVVVTASSPTVNSISPMKAFLKYMAVAWSGNNGEMVSQARNAGTVT